MDLWIRRFRTSTPVGEQDRVYIPGEIETEILNERIKKGISVPKTVLGDLIEIGKRFEVDFYKHLENDPA